VPESTAEIVTLGGPREAEDTPHTRPLGDRATDALHPLGSHERAVEEHLLHLLAHVVGGWPVRHAAGEAALEQSRRPGEDHAADALRKGERGGQGHVAAQGVAADDRPRKLERVEKVDDPAGERVDGRGGDIGIEDRQRRRHRPACTSQLIEHIVPVVHLAHQAVEQDDRLSFATLEPPVLRVCRYAHGVPLFGPLNRHRPPRLSSIDIECRETS